MDPTLDKKRPEKHMRKEREPTRFLNKFDDIADKRIRQDRNPKP